MMCLSVWAVGCGRALCVWGGVCLCVCVCVEVVVEDAGEAGGGGGQRGAACWRAAAGAGLWVILKFEKIKK